jgi:phosphoribosylcarboxyaminoimidazole (NCAIR) mutase
MEIAEKPGLSIVRLPNGKVAIVVVEVAGAKAAALIAAALTAPRNGRPPRKPQ